MNQILYPLMFLGGREWQNRNLPYSRYKADTIVYCFTCQQTGIEDEEIQPDHSNSGLIGSDYECSPISHTLCISTQDPRKRGYNLNDGIGC